MKNFIKTNKTYIALYSALIVTVAALVATNAYVMDITRGCYNIFTLIF